MAKSYPFQDLLQGVNIEQVLNGDSPVPAHLRSKKIENLKTAEKVQLPIKNLNQETKKEEKQFSTSQSTKKEIIPNKPNYGHEGETIEFKTSFFYKDGSVKETEQLYDVLKKVCAFLNHKGGILYMGVNDDENGGQVTSLKSDFEFIDRKSYLCKLKGGKMHFYGPDGYARWIVCNIRKKIDLVVRYSLDIAWNYDKNGVLVINIPKGIEDVAILNGKAYIRKGTEAIEMSKEAIERLRVERKSESTMPEHEKKSKELASVVRHSINCKKKVILHDYCSGNSRRMSDRILEIFNCDDNNSYVYAYEASCDKVKQFKLCRAGSIEIMDELWEYEERHYQKERDIFNMTISNESQCETIEIEMSLRAKTLLEEEYPNSKKYIQELSKTKWSLKTTVANVLGVGRFCMGLLDEIRIIKGDLLYSYITGCLSRQINRYCI